MPRVRSTAENHHVHCPIEGCNYTVKTENSIRRHIKSQHKINRRDPHYRRHQPSPVHCYTAECSIGRSRVQNPREQICTLSSGASPQASTSTSEAPLQLLENVEHSLTGSIVPINTSVSPVSSSSSSSIPPLDTPSDVSAHSEPSELSFEWPPLSEGWVESCNQQTNLEIDPNFNPYLVTGPSLSWDNSAFFDVSNFPYQSSTNFLPRYSDQNQSLFLPTPVDSDLQWLPAIDSFAPDQETYVDESNSYIDPNMSTVPETHHMNIPYYSDIL